MTGRVKAAVHLVEVGEPFGEKKLLAPDIFFADFCPDLRWRRRLVHSFIKQFGREGLGRIFGNEVLRKLGIFKKLSKELVRPWLDKAIDDDRKSGFIHRFLEISEEDKANYNTSQLVIEAALWQTVLTAGLTTSATFTVLINCLVFYPEVQEKLQKEVENVAGKSRSITLADRKHMPYHLATIYEANRYGSIIPLGFPHEALETTTLAGYTIQKGTGVWTNLYGLHHDENFWDHPESFNPGRFLDAEGNLVPADHPNRKRLLPFGAGTRTCVGQVFAQTRMFLALATLMQTFSILPETDIKSQLSCDRNIMLKPGLITESKPFKVRMQPI